MHMEHLKLVSGNYDLDEKHVLKFVIYINDSGRALVHYQVCSNVGSDSLEECEDTLDVV